MLTAKFIRGARSHRYEEPRLVMNWNGKAIVNISREFLNSNGAEKHITAVVSKPEPYGKKVDGGFTENYLALADDLNICTKRGLSEQIDSTIGAGTVLMPFGGKNQLTPIQGNGAENFGREKAYKRLLAYGVGLQPVHYRKKPLPRRLPCGYRVGFKIGCNGCGI
ncbi:MAG: hypothetical protein ACLR56_03355 [Oscillospiraceae bacterium]